MAIAFGTVTDQEEQYSPIDDGRYMFQVSDLQQLEPNEWGNPRIQWYLSVAEQVNNKWVPVLDGEGQQYIKYAFTNLPKDGKAMGPNNQTRIMVEKILGRKLEDGETASDEMVRGKIFIGMLGPYRSKTGKVSQILMPESIKPFGNGKAKAEPAPPPPPPVAETVDDDDSDELPFG